MRTYPTNLSPVTGFLGSAQALLHPSLTMQQESIRGLALHNIHKARLFPDICPNAFLF